MNIKKFALFIIIAGFVVSAFAVIRFVSISTELNKRLSAWEDLEKQSRETSQKYGIRTDPDTERRHARALGAQIDGLKEDAAKARKQPTLILIIGGGIIFLGAGLYFSAKKEPEARDTPQA